MTSAAFRTDGNIIRQVLLHHHVIIKDQFIIMSAQVERPYRILTDNLTIQDTIKTKTPLSGSFSYYQQYLRLLDRNADRLKSLFREQNRDYLKGLLEELDNNVEMAI
jgi:hypothetical protein